MYLDAFLTIIKHLVLKGRQGNRLDVVVTSGVVSFFKRDIMKLIALLVAALLPCGDGIDEATVDSRIQSALTREVALHSAKMDERRGGRDGRDSRRCILRGGGRRGG